jgi:hypothetical protein
MTATQNSTLKSKEYAILNVETAEYIGGLNYRFVYKEEAEQLTYRFNRLCGYDRYEVVEIDIKDN